MLKRLAILAIVMFAAGSMSSQPNKAASQEQRNAAQRQPIAVDSIGQGKQNHGQPDQSNARSESPKRNATLERSRWWADSTWWLVIIAALTGIAIGWQARLLRRTLDEVHVQAGHMREQTEILRGSVATAQKAADAADISAKAAMGVALPVLVLQELEFENHGSSYEGLFKYPILRISVKNFGQSPAFLRSYAVVVTTTALPKIPVYPDKPWELDMQEVVDAGTAYTFSEGRSAPNRNPDDATVETLISMKDSPVVYGFVEYGDVFGSDIHVMKFSKVFAEIGPNGKNTLMIDWGGPQYTGQQEHKNPN